RPHASRSAGPSRRRWSFVAFQERYSEWLERVMSWRWALVAVYLAACGLLITVLLPGTGREIFPSVDTGQFRVRMRAPTGTRIEETEQEVLAALNVIRGEVGEQNIAGTLAFIGVQPSSYPI